MGWVGGGGGSGQCPMYKRDEIFSFFAELWVRSRAFFFITIVIKKTITKSVSHFFYHHIFW